MKMFFAVFISLLATVCLMIEFPLPILFFVGFPLIFVLLSKRFEWGIYSLCFLIPMQYFFTPYYLGLISQNFVWLDEIIILVMFSLVVLNKLTTGKRFNLTAIDYSVLWFVLFVLTFSFIGLSNPAVVLLGIRSFLQYYLLYFCIKNFDGYMGKEKVIIILLVGTAIIQIPIGIYQFITWTPTFYNPLTGGFVNRWDLSYYDAVVGTFGRGAANNFGYLMASAIIFLIGLYIKLRDKRLLILSFFMLIPFTLSQSRGAFVVFFFLLILFYGKYLIVNIKRFLVPFVLIVTFFVGIVVFYFNYTRFDVSDFFDVENIMKQQTTISSGASGRLVGLKVANDILFNRGLSILVGTGAGSFSSTTGVFLKSPLYVETIKKLNSERCITESDIVPALVEFGYLGTCLFLTILILMFLRARNIYNKSNDVSHKAYAFALSPALIIFILSGFLVRAWEMQYLAFYFWFGLAWLEKDLNKVGQ